MSSAERRVITAVLSGRHKIRHFLTEVQDEEIVRVQGRLSGSHLAKLLASQVKDVVCGRANADQRLRVFLESPAVDCGRKIGQELLRTSCGRGETLLERLQQSRVGHPSG